MKDYEIELLTNVISRKIKEFLSEIEFVSPNIVAVCEHKVPIDKLVADLYKDQKQINLSRTFNRLSTYEKLIVVKASIGTHLNLMRGEVPGYGKIIEYQLFYNSNIFNFNLQGDLISNKEL